jgi:hypothetical protein
LEQTVGIDQLRTDDADRVVALGGRDQMIQPSIANEGIVVQEADVFAARECGAAIARRHEAFVFSVANVVDTVQAGN